jgi:hypothetical protein
MVDAPTDAARNAGKNPQEEGRGAFAFAGLVFDLDACTLKLESGEAIPLTRGEFARQIRTCRATAYGSCLGS